MNGQQLFDLLAKAQLHPQQLMHIEKLIVMAYRSDDSNLCNLKLLINAAAELEQLQQATEVQRVTEWLGEAE